MEDASPEEPPRPPRFPRLRARLGRAREWLLRAKEWLRSWARRAESDEPQADDFDEQLPISPEDVDAIERVYRDIQGFARHMDERLRSLITALAFLTTAGIAIFVFASRPDANDLTFDGYSWNVANVFFVAFLVSAALSLSSALVALDPTAHRPHFLRGERRNLRSLLYYEAVGEDWWARAVDERNVAQLNGRLYASYKRDASEIARRSRHKVERAQNAEALMEFALGALLVVGIARLPDSGAGTRTWLVIGCLVLFAGSPYVTYLRLRHSRFPALAGDQIRNRTNLWRLSSFYVLPISAAAALAALCLFGGRAHWPCVLFAAGWSGVGRLIGFWKHGHWIGLLLGFAGVVLFTAMSRDASLFQGPTRLTLEMSYARRVPGKEPRSAVCAHIRGRANAEVELLIEGGPSVPTTPITVRLSNRGEATISVEGLPGTRYAGEARDLRDPSIATAATAIPGPGEPAEPGPFRCPPPPPEN